jgi:hypothetical protein
MPETGDYSQPFASSGSPVFGVSRGTPWGFPQLVQQAPALSEPAVADILPGDNQDIERDHSTASPLCPTAGATEPFQQPLEARPAAIRAHELAINHRTRR